MDQTENEKPRAVVSQQGVGSELRKGRVVGQRRMRTVCRSSLLVGELLMTQMEEVRIRTNMTPEAMA